MAMLAWCSFFLPFARYFPSHHCCPTHCVIISNADAYMPPAQLYHVTRARQGVGSRLRINWDPLAPMME